MKFSRLFRLGKQGYDIYRGSKGKGKSGHSSGYSSGGHGGGSSRRSGGTLERLIRRFLR